MTYNADRTAGMVRRCASNTSRDRQGASRTRAVACTGPHVGCAFALSHGRSGTLGNAAPYRDVILPSGRLRLLASLHLFTPLRRADGPAQTRSFTTSRNCHRRVGAAPWEVTWKPSSSSALPSPNW